MIFSSPNPFTYTENPFLSNIRNCFSVAGLKIQEINAHDTRETKRGFPDKNSHITDLVYGWSQYRNVNSAVRQCREPESKVSSLLRQTWLTKLKCCQIGFSRVRL